MTGKGDHRAIAIPAAVFVVTAAVAARDRLVPGEAGVVQALNGNAVLGVFPIDPLLVGVMVFGTLVGVVVVAAVMALLLKPWQPAVAVLGAGAAGWFLSRVCKGVVDRGRPVEFLDPRTLDISSGYASITGAGFPSGHAAVAFAVATVVAPWVPHRYRSAPWAVAAAVAFARVHVAAHFPLDVLGGAALGIVIGGIVNLVAPGPDEFDHALTR